MQFDIIGAVRALADDYCSLAVAVRGRSLGKGLPDLSGETFTLGDIPVEFSVAGLESASVMQIAALVLLLQESTPDIIIHGGSAYVLNGGREETHDLDYRLLFPPDADQGYISMIDFAQPPSGMILGGKELFKSDIRYDQNCVTTWDKVPEFPCGYNKIYGTAIDVYFPARMTLIKEWLMRHKERIRDHEIGQVLPESAYIRLFGDDGRYSEYVGSLMNTRDYRFLRRSMELSALEGG